MPLRRAADIQRTLDLEMLATVIGGMDFVYVEIDTSRAITDEGIILKTLPKLFDDCDMFRRPLIPRRMGKLLITVEVPRGGFACGRDNIPPGSTS